MRRGARWWSLHVGGRGVAWLIFIPQVVVLGVLCILIVAALNPWFFPFLPVLLVPATVLGASVHRAGNRIREPWREWAWIDVVLNVSIFFIGSVAWWWALSISLRDIDSVQVFWLAVSAGWLLTVAGAASAIVVTIRRAPGDTGLT